MFALYANKFNFLSKVHRYRCIQQIIFYPVTFVNCNKSGSSLHNPLILVMKTELRQTGKERVKRNSQSKVEQTVKQEN